MTKNEIMAQLDVLGVEYSKRDTKATLEKLLDAAFVERVPFSGRVEVDLLNVRAEPDGEIIGQLKRYNPIYGEQVGAWVYLRDGGCVRVEHLRPLVL